MAEHNTLTGSSLHEPKGVSTANEGEIYIADGAGSGDWTAVSSAVADAHICVYLDPQEQTRSFSSGDLDTILPFSLDYSSTEVNNFTWDNTAKEITYTGTANIVVTINATMSLRLVGAGSPTLRFYVQKYTGGAWVTNVRSMSARKFSSNDVGNMTLGCLGTMNVGEKIRLVVECNQAESFVAENINFYLAGVITP